MRQKRDGHSVYQKETTPLFWHGAVGNAGNSNAGDLDTINKGITKEIPSSWMKGANRQWAMANDAQDESHDRETQPNRCYKQADPRATAQVIVLDPVLWTM